jgi:hypothetical protein
MIVLESFVAVAVADADAAAVVVIMFNTTITIAMLDDKIKDDDEATNTKDCCNVRYSCTTQ